MLETLGMYSWLELVPAVLVPYFLGLFGWAIWTIIKQGVPLAVDSVTGQPSSTKLHQNIAAFTVHILFIVYMFENIGKIGALDIVTVAGGYMAIVGGGKLIDVYSKEKTTDMTYRRDQEQLPDLGAEDFYNEPAIEEENDRGPKR